MFYLGQSESHFFIYGIIQFEPTKGLALERDSRIYTDFNNGNISTGTFKLAETDYEHTHLCLYYTRFKLFKVLRML